MAYTILLKQSAETDLEQLDSSIHDRIVSRLLVLQEEPLPRGVRKLRGREGYRLRVGDYRILYVVNQHDKTVEIFSVSHRNEAYGKKRRWR
jgi:mRNA interferase RelE/StbE